LPGHNEVSCVETTCHGSSLDKPPERFPKKDLANRMSTKLDFLSSLKYKIPGTQSETNELDLDVLYVVEIK